MRTKALNAPRKRVNSNSSTPAQVVGLSGVTRIAGGEDFSLAVSQGSGTLSAWGNNGTGQLGDGSFLFRTTPVLAVGSDAP